jgi:GTP-binding protein HflX
LVLNKADKVPDRSFLDVLKAHHDESVVVSASQGDGLDRLELAVREALRIRYPQAVPISAKTGAGISRLANAVGDALSQDFLDLDLHCDASDGRLLAYLAKYGEVLSRTFVGHRASIHVRIARKHLGVLRENPTVELHAYAPPGATAPSLLLDDLNDDAVGEVA